MISGLESDIALTDWELEDQLFITRILLDPNKEEL